MAQNTRDSQRENELITSSCILKHIYNKKNKM